MDLFSSANRFHIRRLPGQDSLKALEQDVCDGLLTRPRSLPPKYFYDSVGSRLFAALCKTADYYPARTEFALLTQCAEEIIAIARPGTCIELGAGTSTKTEILLSALNTGPHLHTYVTIDICEEVLVESAHRLLNSYPNLHVNALVGEYLPAIQALRVPDKPVLYIFIGSSLGNFTAHESIKLLTAIARKMRTDDYLLLGLDRVKGKTVLETAYDDAEGITRQFNLNVLHVLNHKLHANFDTDRFSHQAVYNGNYQQIEMYLVSGQVQSVTFPTLRETMQLAKDEKILTEISRKYTRQSMQRLLSKSGLIERAHYAPANGYFSLLLAACRRRS